MGTPIANEYLTEQEQYRGSRPGMAHFAGTGPRGKECWDCAFYGRPDGLMRSRGMRCRKYAELMGGWHVDPLPSGARACKYFEQKKK